MPLASRQKKQNRALEKRMNDGYPGLVTLGSLYAFETFLVEVKGWHSAVTRGNELLHVYRHKGEEIVVTYNETKHKTTTTRRGMVLWYDWLIFWKGEESL